MRLKTRLVLVAILLQLYCLGVGASFWIQSGARHRLEESLSRDLAVLGKLPRLRDQLRQLDLLTDRYLAGGSARSLDKRREVLAEVRRTLGELSSGARPEEESLFLRLDRELAALLVQQGEWISRKSSGRLAAAEVARFSARASSVDPVVESVMDMKDSSISTLATRRAEVARAERQTLGLILGTGMVLGLVLVLWLSRYLIKPVSTLEAYARGWQLGRPWELSELRAGAEVVSLLECLKSMAARLNKQFGAEQDLGSFRTQLVAMVSHEFNNSLSVIHGVAVLLKATEGKGDPARRTHFYEVIDANVRSLGNSCRNLLNMGRLESGCFAITPRKTELGTLLRDTAARLDILWGRRNQELAWELPDSPPVEALGDPEALSLVATNLLSNAIKYTPEGGRITIGAGPDAADSSRIRVYFKDSGIGVAPEEKDRILTGYYRTEAGKNAAKGFGVGLALVSAVLEAHGAALTVESEPGKGSCFSFSLPVFKA